MSTPFTRHNKMERISNGPHWALLCRVPSGDKVYIYNCSTSFRPGTYKFPPGSRPKHLKTRPKAEFPKGTAGSRTKGCPIVFTYVLFWVRKTLDTFFPYGELAFFFLENVLFDGRGWTGGTVIKSFLQFSS